MKKAGRLSGSIYRMAVLLAGVLFTPAGVLFAAFLEFECGGKNSLTAFQPFRVNHIVYAEPPSFPGYQSN
jgi:hypothetical protein